MNPETPKLNITPRPEKTFREKVEDKMDLSAFSYSEEEINKEWPYAEKKFYILDETKNPVGSIQYNYPKENTDKKLFKVRLISLEEAYRNKGVGIGLYEQLLSLARQKGLDGIKSDNKVGGGALAIWKKLQEEGYLVNVNPKAIEKWTEFLKSYDEGKFFRKDIIVPAEESVFELLLKEKETPNA